MIRHIIVVDYGKDPESRDDSVSSWISAIYGQLISVAHSYGLVPPGISYHGSKPPSRIVTGDALMAIVDDSGRAESMGFHGLIANSVYGVLDLGRTDSPSRTMSHEMIEMFVNAYLDRWVPGPGGLYALEPCDPVQRSSYHIGSIEVSDWVTPLWFGLPSTSEKLTRFSDFVKNPFEILEGGYCMVQSNGVVKKLGATIAGDVGSRVSRIMTPSGDSLGVG